MEGEVVSRVDITTSAADPADEEAPDFFPSFEPAVAVRGVTIERTATPPRIIGRMFLRAMFIMYLLVESHGW